MNNRCTLIYVAIYWYWSEGMALFWRCWYWGNNDNRAKNSNRQEDFWGNFLGNLPQLSWNNAFCGQLGLMGSYWVQETVTIESIERYLSLSVTTNHITHFASPSPGFCFRRFMATIRSCMPDTLLQQTWTPHKLSCLSVRKLPTVLKVFLLFLLKRHFCWGGGGGFSEDSDCLPSAFKILSERLNVKGKFRAKPQHTHQSLSKQREGLLPRCG